MSKSELEERLALQIRAVGLPEPVREHRFHPVRKWRFDFAYPERKIGIEVEGGVWVKGRHTRGSGFIEDCEKYNEAALLGWAVLRFPVNMIEDGTAVQMIERVMQA